MPLPPPVPKQVAFNPAPTNSWAPQRTVQLSAFHIDRFEVTWERYRACVDAGICLRAGLSTFPSTREALTDPLRSRHPAYNILYAEAVTFCRWDGKHLPTEAEWERAARGTDNRDYPWGNENAGPQLLAALTTYAPESKTADVPDPVGTHGQDVSADGVHDLFASVQEWVADWYDPDGYATSVAENPTGPAAPAFTRRADPSGNGNWITAAGERVLRGDRWSLVGGRSWDLDGRGAPVWFRGKLSPNATGAGFRCARSDVDPLAATGARFPVYEISPFRPFTPRSGR